MTDVWNNLDTQPALGSYFRISTEDDSEYYDMIGGSPENNKMIFESLPSNFVKWRILSSQEMVNSLMERMEDE